MTRSPGYETVFFDMIGARVAGKWVKSRVQSGAPYAVGLIIPFDPPPVAPKFTTIHSLYGDEPNAPPAGESAAKGGVDVMPVASFKTLFGYANVEGGIAGIHRGANRISLVSRHIADIERIIDRALAEQSAYETEIGDVFDKPQTGADYAMRHQAMSYWELLADPMRVDFIRAIARGIKIPGLRNDKAQAFLSLTIAGLLKTRKIASNTDLLNALFEKLAVCKQRDFVFEILGYPQHAPFGLDAEGDLVFCSMPAEIAEFHRILPIVLNCEDRDLVGNFLLSAHDEQLAGDVPNLRVSP